MKAFTIANVIRTIGDHSVLEFQWYVIGGSNGYLSCNIDAATDSATAKAAIKAAIEAKLGSSLDDVIEL